MISQTRFKVTIFGLILGLIEALCKTFFPAFPAIETFSFQSAIIGAYLTIKTVNNVKRIGEKNED